MENSQTNAVNTGRLALNIQWVSWDPMTKNSKQKQKYGGMIDQMRGLKLGFKWVIEKWQ